MDRVQITMEFIFRASPAMIYKFLSVPSSIIRWFCDEADIDGKEYTFIWSGSPETATLIDDVENERLRFEWEDAEEDEYLDYAISKSPVTGETILEITDFCDEDEVDDQRALWEEQMARLKRASGG